MRHDFLLISLVLLAVSCGGRHGKQGDEGAAADSLATESVEKPAKKTASKADTVSLANYRNRLPQEPFFDIVTSMGTIRVKLYKDTPKHRDNFVRLSLSHFYDETLFHRVVPGFVIQGGDPYTKDTTRVEEWGEGGPGYNIDPEFVPEHRHKKGALAAARRGDFANPAKESNGSQFYLVVDSTACSHLNGEYTVFGETVGGLNVIDRIARTQVDRYNRPEKPVVILRITPNAQMNKRALEDERQTLGAGATPETLVPEVVQPEEPAAQENDKSKVDPSKVKSVRKVNGHVIEKVK
ncbi:MAG: peptidylprolyl isomerase [Bacteroidales bacterium]|nr:peptidylprolyl isomerase [Bacteroidales bacterium]